MFEVPIYLGVTEKEFLNIVDRNCVYNIISDEIDIIFISELKEMILQHYMNQPRSMFCRKLERNYIAENNPRIYDLDYEYNFLPYCFRQKGFQPPPLLNILPRWMI